MEVNYEVGPHKWLGWHIVVTLGSLASGAMGASFSVLLNNSSHDDDEKERVRKTIIIVLLR